MDGQEHQTVIRAQGGDHGTFVAFEADGDRLACEPLAQGTSPRLNGCWCVCEAAVLSWCGARCLSAHLMFGIRPVEADKNSACFVRFVLHE
jgi:hypothetical protein